MTRGSPRITTYDAMPKRKSNPAELVLMTANPAELVVMGANPREKRQQTGNGRAKNRQNPGGLEGASKLYEDFHGEPGQHVDTYREPDARPVTLAEIGTLLELEVKRPTGWKWAFLDFKMRGVKVAANPEGNQLYFIGGDQKICRGDLTAMGVDNSRALIDLGECMTIGYRARKLHVDGISSGYTHKFGEESGIRPRLIYDRRGPEPRIQLAGGDYIAKTEGIVN